MTQETLVREAQQRRRADDSQVPRNKPGVHLIGHMVFDSFEGVLHHADGRRLVFRLQTAQVLAYLVASPHRLLTKQELLEKLWCGRAVTEDSLVQCICELRRALGDAQQTLIVTEPKRGYRWIPPP